MSADPGLKIVSDVRNSLTHSSEGMSMDIKVARAQAAIITSSKRTTHTLSGTALRES